MALRAAVTPERPLGPTERNAQEEQGGEVGEHERPAAVLGRLARKAQEVPQADRRSGDRHDHADARFPTLDLRHGFLGGRAADDRRRMRG